MAKEPVAPTLHLKWAQGDRVEWLQVALAPRDDCPATLDRVYGRPLLVPVQAQWVFKDLLQYISARYAVVLLLLLLLLLAHPVIVVTTTGWALRGTSWSLVPSPSPPSLSDRCIRYEASSPPRWLPRLAHSSTSNSKALAPLCHPCATTCCALAMWPSLPPSQKPPAWGRARQSCRLPSPTSQPCSQSPSLGKCAASDVV